MIQLSNLKPVDPRIKAKLEESWSKVLERTDVGFTRLAESDADWKALDDRLKQCRPTKKILVIGIGGSSLGTQVIYEALRGQNSAQMTFLESPDPDVWRHLRGLNAPEWKDKHVVIVSKSGNTLETLSWVERIAANEPAWLKHSQCTVIASPGEGALQKWAAKEKLPMLWIPRSVGGRFSVLTAAGMFPAGLMGLKLDEFRSGAAWALKNLDMATHLSAEILASWERGEWITQMWTYSESARVLGEWWQQLWGESLGKKLDRTGSTAPRASTPMACRGPRDQHSLVQQLIDSVKDKYIFISRVRAVENSDDTFKASLFPTMPFFERQVSLGRVMSAEAEAFEKSLNESGISNSTMFLDGLSERTLGAAFMLWQMVIAQLGEYMDVDAFNQPGVELGKIYAHKILSQ
jgi:glucose-6-phosphate isomerase